MVDFLRRMRGAEAVGFWATVAVVVLCLMPWKVTALDGEVAGVASLGIVTLLGSLGALLSIILRRLRATPLSSLTLCLAQVGALALCLLWTLICIKLSFDGRLVQDSYSAAQVPISRPAFGAVAAVIASLVALIGGVGTLNQAAD